jgi:thiol-disulfide isomerase/thioredoxin
MHLVQPQAPPVPVSKKLGEAAPEIELKDLSGETVKLKDFEGEKVLVLFWNPGCGFCQQMLPDLKEWESDPPEGAPPKLLVVSAGTAEANEAMGLGSPVVLDQQFNAGRAFGVSGTPSAVLVDEEGKIASEAAVGAPAVLALATTAAGSES